ncbi:MAG: hypothetical protein Q7T17_00755 [Microbacterium sp.]|nr:hypothetical protein [Microbacterium sp.]MDO8381502.1 hypothetical protein [Microbacterium sp.]
MQVVGACEVGDRVRDLGRVERAAAAYAAGGDLAVLTATRF